MKDNDKLKRDDQIRLLQAAMKYTDTGTWDGIFTYPQGGPDLVRMGLATIDQKVTPAGRAALWLLGLGPDPTTSKAVITFDLSKGSADEG